MAWALLVDSVDLATCIRMLVQAEVWADSDGASRVRSADTDQLAHQFQLLVWLRTRIQLPLLQQLPALLKLMLELLALRFSSVISPDIHCFPLIFHFSAAQMHFNHNALYLFPEPSTTRKWPFNKPPQAGDCRKTKNEKSEYLSRDCCVLPSARVAVPRTALGVHRLCAQQVRPSHAVPDCDTQLEFDSEVRTAPEGYASERNIQ